jgi:MFS family permease
MFCAGMLWVAIWTLADGFADSFVQLAIFRALQGMGAAMTVPSAVSVISSYYVREEKNRALSIFAAAGPWASAPVSFGGFLTSSLGWRYIFWLSVIVTGVLGIVGWIILPADRRKGLERPKLDFTGAALSTGGLILLSFVLSSGGLWRHAFTIAVRRFANSLIIGTYGWNKAFIIALLIGSVALLCIFTWVEKKASNPIMPLGLWQLPNFAGLWAW